MINIHGNFITRIIFHLSIRGSLGSGSSRSHLGEEIGVRLGAAASAGHLDDALKKSRGVLATSAAVGSLGFLASFLNQFLLFIHQELVIVASSESCEGDAEGICGAELGEEEIAAKGNY